MKLFITEWIVVPWETFCGLWPLWAVLAVVGILLAAQRNDVTQMTNREYAAFDLGLSDAERLGEAARNPFDSETQRLEWEAWATGASVGMINRNCHGTDCTN